MKRILGFVLLLAMVLAVPAYAVAPVTDEIMQVGHYDDVQPGDWYAEPVGALTDIGIVKGVGNNLFDPHREVSRAEYVTMLVRAANIPLDEATPEMSWSTPFMNAGYRYGIINEIDYPVEEAHVPMNRYEASETTYFILKNYFSYTDSDISEVLSYIPDTIPEKYMNQVGHCYLWGFINGTDTAGTFSGEKTLTRAEASMIIYRLIYPETRKPWTAPEYKEFGQIIGEYTTYTTDNANRNFNVNKAAESMNGVVLQPGEQFSYYKTIGNPGKAAGYKLAKVISNGKYVNGYGGGVCQNATTLFNAVLRANLQIDERRAHGLKSSYVSPGYDATFSSGSIDFKFTNNYDFPIKIECVFNDANNSLNCKIYGRSNYVMPNVELKTSGSGHSWTLYRYVDGEVNYTAYSNYRD